MGVYKYDSTNDELNPIAGSTTYADLAVGSIIPYGGTTPPISFLMCDGLEVPKADYPELYAVIGDAFGSASETTHFKLPDLRECVPVGVGKNITKSIANHDRYNLGQFKDDALGTHDHPLKTVTTATYNTAGVPVGVAVNNTPTSATHGKQVGVNYIIKAKNTGCPSDIGDAVEDLVEDLMDDYQTKDLTSAVEGATTVEGALGALSTNKQPKTLDTPLTINGVSRTTVENALSELNKAVNQRYGKNFNSAHGRYVKIGSIPISDTTSKRCQIDLLIFNNQLYGKVHLSLESRNNALAINGSSDIDLSMTDTVKPRIVASKDETNGVFNVYVDSSYTYLGIILYQYFPVSTFEVANFSDSASVDGTKVFDSSTDLTKIAYVKADTYSTSETKTNKVWIDGKPIYRKVFTGLTRSSVAGQWVNTGANITGVNIGIIICFNAYDSVASINRNAIDMRIDDGKLFFYTGFENPFDICTLEYTKTTD